MEEEEKKHDLHCLLQNCVLLHVSPSLSLSLALFLSLCLCLSLSLMVSVLTKQRITVRALSSDPLCPPPL